MRRLFKPKVSIIKLEPEEDKSKKKRRPVKRGKKIKDEFKDFELIDRLDEDTVIEKEWLSVTNKTKWKCMRCGWCCCHNWRINLTWKEYERIKDKLTITEVVIDEATGMSHPVYTFKEKCERYDAEGHKCTIYKDRLFSCAAFPFLYTDEGDLLRSKHCKGFGKGEVVDKKKTIQYLQKWRKKAGLPPIKKR